MLWARLIKSNNVIGFRMKLCSKFSQVTLLTRYFELNPFHFLVIFIPLQGNRVCVRSVSTNSLQIGDHARLGSRKSYVRPSSATRQTSKICFNLTEGEAQNLPNFVPKVPGLFSLAPTLF